MLYILLLEKREKTFSKLRPVHPKSKRLIGIRNSSRFITCASVNLLEKFQFVAAQDKTPTKPKKQEDRKDDGNQMYQDIIVNEIMPSASPIRQPKSSAKKILYYTNLASPVIERRDIFSSCTLSPSSQIALQKPKKVVRHIPKTPYKVLDAPELQDDFYLNLVDWSCTNFLGVGLGSCVYLWNATTSKVVKLCDLGSNHTVTSVNWIQRVILADLGKSYCSWHFCWYSSTLGCK